MPNYFAAGAFMGGLTGLYPVYLNINKFRPCSSIAYSTGIPLLIGGTCGWAFGPFGVAIVPLLFAVPRLALLDAELSARRMGNRADAEAASVASSTQPAYRKTQSPPPSHNFIQ